VWLISRHKTIMRPNEIYRSNRLQSANQPTAVSRRVMNSEAIPDLCRHFRTEDVRQSFPPVDVQVVHYEMDSLRFLVFQCQVDCGPTHGNAEERSQGEGCRSQKEDAGYGAWLTKSARSPETLEKPASAISWFGAPAASPDILHSTPNPQILAIFR